MPSLYETQVAPQYIELAPDHPMIVKPGGFLVRPGFHRTSGAGTDYADRVAKRADNDSCVFCEPRLTTEQAIVHRGKHIVAFTASAPYEFFDGHPTGSGGHQLVVPTLHTDSPSEVGSLAAEEMAEYFAHRQQEADAITFVREEGNPSKSVQHVHYHSISLDPSLSVSAYAYNLQEGVTELVSEPILDLPVEAHETDETVRETPHFVIARPARPFGHFDGQEVLRHWRIRLPDPRDGTAMAAVGRHLARAKAATPPDQRFQTYRPPVPMNRALGPAPESLDVMYLGLNPVYNLQFDRACGGVTELVFARLSLKTIAKINEMHQRR